MSAKSSNNSITAAAGTLLLLTLNLITITSVQSIPMKFSIPVSNKECLYTPVSRDEFITTSLFITDGNVLRARMMLQGPITSNKSSSSAEILAAGLRFEKTGRQKNSLSLNIDTDVDFESLYDHLEEELDMDDDFADDDHFADDDDAADDVDDAIFGEFYYEDDDDEYEFIEDDGMDDIEITEIREAKAERERLSKEEIQSKKDARRREQMKQFQEVKRRKEEKKRAKEKKKAERQTAYHNKMAAMKKARQQKDEGKEKLRDGEALQKTFQVREEGWYRYCVQSVGDLIEVEMEIRTSSEVGAPNKKTGHLQTYEHQDMLHREKKLLMRMTSAKLEGNGIKESDLLGTKKMVSKLNKLLYDIRDKQKNERHRLAVHKAVNEHSHSRMVLNSLFETVFYIGVSAFQVYTIRKWFSGSPILSY